MSQARPSGLSRRSVLSAGLFGAAGATLAACAPNKVGASSPPNGDALVIGTDLELSGHSLVVGQAQLNAIRIVANGINANGFVAGGRTRKITLMNPFDNLSEPDQAIAGMNRLIDNSNVSVIIGAGSSQLSIGMAKVAEQHQIPMISLASASSITAPISAHHYSFRLGPNAVDVAKMLATAIKQRRYQRVAVMYAADNLDPGAPSADGRTQMSAALAAAGLTEAVAVAIPSGAVSAGLPVTPHPSQTGPDRSAKSDMADQVKAAMDSSPDAVVIWAVAPMSGLAARSLRNAGYRGQFFFDSGAASSETLSPQNQTAVEGALVVAPAILGGAPVAVTTPAAAARVNFYNTYTAQYRTFDGLAPYGGDAIKLIVQAVIQSGVTDRQSLRESIEQTSFFEGLAGSYTFGPNYHGGVSGESLSLFGIQHSGWVSA
jgi:branched-chain amino acid transport system substrate-binding protein